MCCLSTRKEGRGAERGTLKLGDGEEGDTLGIASSGFPIPDFSGPEEKFPGSGNFNSRSGNREMAFLSFFRPQIFQIQQIIKRVWNSKPI